MTKQELIQKHQNLFWYFDKNKLSEISEAVVVEFILNYGNMEALKDLFIVFGKEKTADIFKKSLGNQRNNYFPQVKSFFNLYFQKYVSGYSF